MIRIQAEHPSNDPNAPPYEVVCFDDDDFYAALYGATERGA